MGDGDLLKMVTDALWAARKQIVTGVCECTSLLGPCLCGGHGILQARHGLVADRFVFINVDKADGTLQSIDAESDAGL